MQEDKIVSKDDFTISTKTTSVTLVSEEFVRKKVENICSQATERFDDISLRGSGWVLVGLKYLDINLTSLTQPKAYFHPRNATSKTTTA